MKKHLLLLGVLLVSAQAVRAQTNPTKSTGEVFDLPTGDAVATSTTLPPAALPAPAPVVTTTTTTLPKPAASSEAPAVPTVSARPEGLKRVWETSSSEMPTTVTPVRRAPVTTTTMPRPQVLPERPIPRFTRSTTATMLPPPPPTTTLPPAPPFVALAPWYAPNFEGSLAENWMRTTVAPFLSRSHESGPQALSLPRRLRLTVALGYQAGQNSLAGYALDPFMRSLVDRVFMDSCELNDRRQNCDFKVVHTSGLETFYTREGVDGLIEEVRVMSGAYTEREDVNRGSEFMTQNSRSYQTAEAFAASFSDSDLVIYIGRVADTGLVFRADGRGTDLTAELSGRMIKTPMLVVISPDSPGAIVKQVQVSGSRISVLPINVRGAADAVTAGLGAVDLFLRQGNLRDLSDFLASGGF